MNEPTLLFTRSDVERLLDMRSCIDGVEQAFRQRGEGRLSPAGVLGVHVDGGGFHAKAAALDLSRPYFVLKINANFPANPSTRGLPTIQGVLVLFDAVNGVPLAVMDSMAITTLRTAATSAVAAKYLARPDAQTATFVGCGAQAQAHFAAISVVRHLTRAFVFDLDTRKADAFAEGMRNLYEFEIVVANDLHAATRQSDVIATLTSARTPILGSDTVSPGAFIAAVGADSEHKQEIGVDLMRAAAIVVDDLEQCATIGELHHAFDAEVVMRDNVRASLDEVVARKKAGRMHASEIIIFDSTGVAIEDVAAAAIVYERALECGAGVGLQFGG